MPGTTKYMQGAELPPFLQKRFKVKPQQFLKITVEEVEEQPETDEEVNVGDDLIEGLKEIVESKAKGIKLPNARDLLNEL
ncbi:MAG: hypothetical protein U9P10_15655 [Thermodesulfobacteriota bacterium]|nr:hypothetical protein [Thermodesulfobacteriota bacterium]